jgi:hypothetical protein
MKLNKLRVLLRVIVDRIQYAPVPGIEIIGGNANWAVNVRLLPRNPKILSGGVGNDITFEYAMNGRFGAKIALFDPSPTGKITIEKISPLADGLVFYPSGLAGSCEIVSFAKPRIPKEGSWRHAPNQNDCSFQCYDYNGALKLAGFKQCDLVKIDIEGFEYGFIKKLLKSEFLPRQIAVEVHEFLPGHSWLDTLSLRYRLFKAGYRLVWKRRNDHLFIKDAD